MNKPTLIMAMREESAGLFEKEGIEVNYCGIGKVNAAYMTAKLIAKGARCILNLGTAGSWPPLDLCTIVECTWFGDRDLDNLPASIPRSPCIRIHTKSLGLRTSICGTGDTFGKAEDKWDVVDMEGYAIARVCDLEGVEFHSYKYITDCGSIEEWQKNLNVAPIRLLACYKNFVGTM